jgi:hypothetical protein
VGQPSWGVEGRGVLGKSELHLNYHQVLIENEVFSRNNLTKKLADIFCKAFLIFKTKSVSVMQNLFPIFKMGIFKFHSRED